MPRKPTKPNYYRSLGGYYVQINKVRYELAKGPEGDPAVMARAEKQFRKLMYLASVHHEGDDNTCFAVVQAYMNHCRATAAPNTVEQRKKVLDPFVTELGEVRVADLTAGMIHDWLLKMGELRRSSKRKGWFRWGPGMRRIAIGVVKSAFIWAEGEKLISRTPLPRRMNRPQTGSRGRSSRLDEAQHQLLYSYASRRKHRDFAHLLALLNATGARPAELFMATAEEWDDDAAQLIIEPEQRNVGRYKMGRTGKRRIINVPMALVPVVRGQVEKYGAGPLFRNEDGGPLRGVAVRKRISEMAAAINRDAELRGEPPPVKKNVSPYSYRHKFCTEWLKAGKSAHDLCVLVGTSMSQLEKHYSHVMEDQAHLRAKLEEFSRKPPDQRGASPGG